MAQAGVRVGGIPKWVRERRSTYLRRHMEKCGFTRGSLADLMGVDQSYISRIVSGVRTPSLEVSVALSERLGVPLAELATALVGPRTGTGASHG